MKRTFAMICVITILFSVTACHRDRDAGENENETVDAPSAEDSFLAGMQAVSSVTEDEKDMETIEIIAGGKAFSVVLYENAAASALLERLPMTLDMRELNGNEKYYYLENSLPANAERPFEIKTGDLMLFGDDCLVLFYKSFSTRYSYTPLGHIDNPDGLAAVLGNSDVQVIFQKG